MTDKNGKPPSEPPTEPPGPPPLDSVDKLLAKDLRAAVKTLGEAEARFLVDAYYMLQDNRIRAAHQKRMLETDAEPHSVISWLFGQNEVLEKQIAKALDYYSSEQPLGAWARSIVGVGPIITAGLLAHIDIRKAPTVGHIWRFAGLDPTVKWGKGEKRPWNTPLKRLCWLLGESFVKSSGSERTVFGPVYRARKDLEIQRNEAGLFKQQAEASLATKKFGADTDARKHYEAGRLPPARIHLRSTRYAVKLFLSAYHECGYFLLHGRLPPRPYVIEHLGHAHYIDPPNMEMIPGWAEARRKLSRGG